MHLEPLEDRRLLAVFTVMNLDDAGPDSLREAIGLANANGVADVIDFQFGLNGVVTLTSGELTITDDLTINGPGTGYLTLSGNNSSRIFNIDDGNNANQLDVVISGLTLTDGSTTGSGGAIRSLESFTLTDSVISGSSALGRGGGVYARAFNGATTTITDSQITGNSIYANYGIGGGVSTRTENGGTTIISRSSITGNTVHGRYDAGGGVFAVTYAGGTTTISGSTISGNLAYSNYSGGAYGGGIQALSYGTTTISNSTISGNTARDEGGGITAYANSGGTIAINHSTVSGNTSSNGVGGGIQGSGSDVSLDHTIVAGNNGLTAPDILGTVSARYSLIGNDTGATITDNGGNLIGAGGAVIDPLIGPLQDNGGSTETHALLVGSPAIDAGDPAFSGPPQNDQRGAPFSRDTGGGIDIGAYESHTKVVIDTLLDESDGDYSAGDFSLREAVLLANAAPGAEAFSFDATLNGGTILLQDGLGEIDITDYVKIDASSLPLGITVHAGDGTDNTFATGDGFRIFNISTITETVVQIGDDFETDTSSDYTVVDDGTPDGTATFAFDYVAAGIPLAPNSSVGDSGGLRFTANDTAGVTDAITAFLNTPIDSHDAKLTVDIFLNVGGISGTTEYAHVGMAGDGTTFNSLFTPISGSGTFLAFNGDGDSLNSDYRWFVESTMTTPTSDPSYLAGSGANTAQLYQDIYPATNGSPKNIWTTLEIFFDGDRIIYRLDGTAIIDSSFSDPLQVTNTLTSPSGLVSLGYADVFTSIANPFQSQFVVYDNLEVEYVLPQSVELVGLTLTGGDAPAAGTLGQGGAIKTADRLTLTDSTILGNAAAFSGGGIFTSGVRSDLTVVGSTISGNASVLSDGGGIYSSSSNVTATDSTITGNLADGYGGGIFGRNSPITVTSSTVSGNTAGKGGGIASRFTGSSLTVTDSTISNNSATDSFSSGGGLYSNQGNLTVSGSTISGNSANFSGGGISSNTDLAGLTTTIINSTISGNTADFDNDGLGEGGGIRNIIGLMVIEHSTITDNTAAAGRGSGVLSRGNTYTLTEVSHTIIAGNTNSDVDFFVSNSFQSFGSNLIGTGNALANFASTGDQTGVANPMLGLLGDNGGPTETHALLTGSPAIDAGDPAIASPPATDQRGLSRIEDGDGSGPPPVIDIGAFELTTPSADFDLDNDVDGFDFLLWQLGFGTPMPNAAKGDGDADNDLDVDGNDLDIWELQYGTAPPLVAAASAPIAAALSATEPVAEPSLSGSELADVALAVALVEEADTLSGKQEFVAHSPPLEFFPPEPIRRSDSVSGPGISSSASTSTPRDNERQSAEGLSPWEETVDEVFASVFE